MHDAYREGNPQNTATRYLFRSDKPKFCYHIASPLGTVCKMQNCESYGKLDTFCDEPPPSRRLCSTCARLAGQPVPKPPASAQILTLPPRPPQPAMSPVVRALTGDKLLAHFGVFAHRADPDYSRVTIDLARRLYLETRGHECPKMQFSTARYILKRLRQGVAIKHGVVDARPPKPAKPPKVKKAKRAKAGKPVALSAQRVAYIVSDAFLASYEWRQARYEALKLSDGCCCLCGRGRPHGAILNVDHIKPRRKHPELALVVDNLQVLCHDCNHGKGNWDQTDWR